MPPKARGNTEVCTPHGTQITQVSVPHLRHMDNTGVYSPVLPMCSSMFVSNPCCGSSGVEGDTRDSKGRRSKRTGGIAQMLLHPLSKSCFGITQEPRACSLFPH